MRSVQIGASLFFVMVSCFIPAFVVSFTNIELSGYLYYVFHINNFANFFIYFWIDRKFRNFVMRRSDSQKTIMTSAVDVTKNIKSHM